MRYHEHVKGDKAECIAAMWPWDQGYLVCKTMSHQDPFYTFTINNTKIEFIK